MLKQTGKIHSNMKLWEEMVLLFILAIIIFLAIMSTGCASLNYKGQATELKWNYMQEHWEYAPATSELRWNYYEKRYEFAQ